MKTKDSKQSDEVFWLINTKKIKQKIGSARNQNFPEIFKSSPEREGHKKLYNVSDYGCIP